MTIILWFLVVGLVWLLVRQHVRHRRHLQSIHDRLTWTTDHVAQSVRADLYRHLEWRTQSLDDEPETEAENA